jgi:excisionase family DNA binding protein
MAHSTSNDEVLTLREVAIHAKAPLRSVRKWIAEGRLRAIRPGRLRLVWRSDLDEFLTPEVSDRPGSQMCEEAK